SRALDLDQLNGTQAVELLRRRLVGWPGADPNKSPLWPFREDEVRNLAQRKPLDARGLLVKCATALNAWLAKRSGEATIIDPEETPPLEELFRKEWTQSLDTLRKEQLSPENAQEERLFRSIRESLELLRLAKTPVGDLEPLQMQEGALA